MQKLSASGTSGEGYSVEQVRNFGKAVDCEVEEVNLEQALPEDLRSQDTPATLLILRQGAKAFVGDERYTKLIEEVKASKSIVDKKAWMRGRVVNKLARYNLCYGEQAQQADYEAKKGTVVAFSTVPELAHLRKLLGEVWGSSAEGLLAELNYYYDQRKCGISYHGDGERRRVIGLRVGSTMNFHYQWYHQGERVGEHIERNLAEGDMYIMSAKAVGIDWKRRKIPTLRHAAGCKKYTA